MEKKIAELHILSSAFTNHLVGCVYMCVLSLLVLLITLITHDRERDLVSFDTIVMALTTTEKEIETKSVVFLRDLS